MKLQITGGYVIDPATGTAAVTDVVVENGRIAHLGGPVEDAEQIDARGCVVCPGLVDIHVDFCEPGFESRETLATGSHAAARGGVTTVVTMPDTNPRIDNAGMVEFIERRARETACIHVRTAAASTKGPEGTELTEMAELRAVGVAAVTNGARDYASSTVMRRVPEYAGMVGLTYLAHCEDGALTEGGVMNEGYTSALLGMAGMPKAAEDIRIDRAVRLAGLTGARVHIQQVTTRGGVEIVRQAKAARLPVTAETAPQYWMLTDAAVKSFNSNAKVNPPLREQEDVEAVIAGLQDGTIDCIASGHAPHTPTEKGVEFALAPFGMIGLETSLALAVTGLVGPGHLPLERVVELMTTGPARCCGLDAGTRGPGAPADITVFEPEATWTVQRTGFASRSRNSPFTGQSLTGQVKYTFCSGRLVYSAQGAPEPF